MIATQTILCPICRAPNRGDARFCQQCGNDLLLDNNHGNYRLVKVIKEGGMGTVYQGLDQAGTEYAIKEMHDRFATAHEREEGIKHFEEEAALLQKLRHPAVPHVYRSFIDEGRYYLAMEYIHGEDLEDRLKRDGQIDEPTVLRWADQLCDVLEYMHSQGLIYRDMKPSNIMITRDNNVKLVDFGIAKLLQPGQRNTMVGTPGYSPPEQYQGLASAKSDIYALAATMHHLLTGRDPRDHPPFSFPLASEINPAISPQTAGALAKALSMDEEHRFQTMDAFRRALPIPTGDYSPTLPFDMPRDTRRPSPRSFPATQPPRARPQPLPVAPPSRPQSVQAPPPPVRVPNLVPPLMRPSPVRNSGSAFSRFLRRILRTVLLLAVLTGVGEAYRPDIVNPILQQIVQSVERLVTPNQSTPSSDTNPVPAAGVDPQTFKQTITVHVAQNASDAQIRSVLRDEYLRQAQKTYQNAQLSIPPTTVGSYQVSVQPDGTQDVTADMTGTIGVPRQ